MSAFQHSAPCRRKLNVLQVTIRPVDHPDHMELEVKVETEMKVHKVTKLFLRDDFRSLLSIAWEEAWLQLKDQLNL